MIRAEVRLYVLARQLGRSTRVLARELEAAGIPVMGTGKARTVFVEDVTRYQQQRAEAASAEQSELRADWVRRAVSARRHPVAADRRRAGTSPSPG